MFIHKYMKKNWDFLADLLFLFEYFIFVRLTKNKIV